MSTAKGGTARGAEALFIQGLMSGKLWLLGFLVAVFCALGGAGYAISTALDDDPSARGAIRLWARSFIPWGSGTVETEAGPRAIRAEEIDAYLRRDSAFRRVIRRVKLHSVGWSLGGLVVFIFAARRAGRKAAEKRHVRGARLVTSRELSRAVRRALPWYRRYDPDRKPRYKLAGVGLPEAAETQHILISGAPGSGKSVAILDLLDQVRARGERAVVYDLNGEFARHFAREEDIILNPFDARSPAWNPWAEVREPWDYRDVAASLIPANPEARETYWADASRDVLEALLAQLSARGERTNRALHDTIFSAPVPELNALLGGTPAARHTAVGTEKTAHNVISTLGTYLGWLRFLPQTPPGGGLFSIRSWIEEDAGDRWLFLTSREDQAELLRPLLSLYLDRAASALLSLAPDTERRRWLIADEVATLQRLPALQNVLAQGRKHGACAVLGLQALPQLRESYGRDGAAAIAATCGTTLILRTVEPETSRWLSDSLGKAEYDEADESLSLGAGGAWRDGISLSRRTQERHIVLPSEIASLPPCTGYLRFPGALPVGRVSYSFRERPVIAERFVPRGDVAQIATPSVTRSAPDSGAEKGGDWI